MRKQGFGIAVIFLRLSLLFLTVNVFPYTVSAQVCPAFPINVTNETELNVAIGCYNGSLAGSYAINITQNISLTATTTAINNTQGAQLQINGNANYIDGSGSYRIFIVSAGNVTIDRMTLQNGNADTAVCNSSLCGGAMLIAQGATVTVNRSSFNSNSAASGAGGAILNQGTLAVNSSTFNANSTRYGGAIYNYTSQASTIASNSTFSGNSATGNLGVGGALFHDGGTMMLYNVTVTANTAGRNGAGVYSNLGTVSLNNTIVAHNSGLNDCASTANSGNFSVVASLDSDGSCGTAITSASINLGALQDNGGSTQTHALLAGSAAINAGDNATCTVAPVNNLDQRGVIRPQNSACDIGAFEVCATSGTIASEIDLESAITCYNTASSGTYEYNQTQAITLTNSTQMINNSQGAILKLNGNAHTIDGAGSHRLFNVSAGTVTIDGSILQNGVANIGGAVLVASGANMTITNSSILNSNSNSGGGIRNDGTLEVRNSLFSGNSTSRSGEGGGLSNYGTADVKSSTFNDNAAAFGAALYTRGTLTVSNTTVSANPARSLAGGIYIFWSGNVTAYNITLSNNSANVGGGVLNNGGTITMHNSIIANTTKGSNCYGTIGGTNSLSDDGSCGSALTQSSSINLGVLASNGCATQHATSTGFTCLHTHALEKGSEAIDAGDNTTCASAPVNNLDQRGIVRPQNFVCDIGAVEKVVDDAMFFPIKDVNGSTGMIYL